MPDYTTIPNYIPTPADDLIVTGEKQIEKLLRPGVRVCFVDVGTIFDGVDRQRLEQMCAERGVVVKNRVTDQGVDALVSGNFEALNRKLDEAVRLKKPLIRQHDFEAWFRDRPMLSGGDSLQESHSEVTLDDLLGFNTVVTISETDQTNGDELDLVLRPDFAPGTTQVVVVDDDHESAAVLRQQAKAHYVPVFTLAEFRAWVALQHQHTTPLSLRRHKVVRVPKEQLEPMPSVPPFYEGAPIVEMTQWPRGLVMAVALSGLAAGITQLVGTSAMFLEANNVAMLFLVISQVLRFFVCALVLCCFVESDHVEQAADH